MCCLGLLCTTSRSSEALDFVDECSCFPFTPVYSRVARGLTFQSNSRVKREQYQGQGLPRYYQGIGVIAFNFALFWL